MIGTSFQESPSLLDERLVPPALPSLQAEPSRARPGRVHVNPPGDSGLQQECAGQGSVQHRPHTLLWPAHISFNL